MSLASDRGRRRERNSTGGVVHERRASLPEHRDLAMREVVADGIFEGDRDRPFPAGHELYNRPTPPPIPERLLSRNRNNNTRGAGISPPPPEEAFNIERHAQFMLLHGRPGSRNIFSGILMDRAFRVEYRTVWGYMLATAISPPTNHARSNMMRLLAAVIALPNRYREHIARRNAERGVEFAPVSARAIEVAITRMSYGEDASPNMTIDEVMDTLMLNGIPPEWIDHAYPWGFHWVDQHYHGLVMHTEFFHQLDDERLGRLDQWGTPPAIPDWSGWYHPSADDLARLRVIVAAEEASGLFSVRDPRWVPYGTPSVWRYLRNRSAPRQSLPAETPGPTPGPSSSVDQIQQPTNVDQDAVMTEPTGSVALSAEPESNDSKDAEDAPAMDEDLDLSAPELPEDEVAPDAGGPNAPK